MSKTLQASFPQPKIKKLELIIRKILLDPKRHHLKIFFNLSDTSVEIQISKMIVGPDVSCVSQLQSNAKISKGHFSQCVIVLCSPSLKEVPVNLTWWG